MNNNILTLTPDSKRICLSLPQCPPPPRLPRPTLSHANLPALPFLFGDKESSVRNLDGNMSSEANTHLPKPRPAYGSSAFESIGNDKVNKNQTSLLSRADTMMKKRKQRLELPKGRLPFSKAA
jgi:hypothetical protein